MNGDNPYLGLRSYDVADRNRFFGRDREAEELGALWLSSRLLTVHGQSGVGKTSLLRAGVLPRIGIGRAEVLPIGRVSPQGVTVPTTTDLGHNPYTFALLSSWAQSASTATLAGTTIGAFLGGRAVLTDRYGDPLPLLAAIDQFEEFYNDLPHRRSYRDEFVEQLVEAIERSPRLRVLVSCREEFLAELRTLERRVDRSAHKQYRVEPLRPAAALEAIIGPLAVTGGRTFAAGVAQRLTDYLRTTRVVDGFGEVHHLVSDSVEPGHLQVVCSAMWDALPSRLRVISHEHLEEHADVERTLARQCAAAVGEVARQEGVPEADLWEWLRREFVTDNGTRHTVYEGVSTTGGMPNSVARALAEQHILRVDNRARSRWYELGHDRLIEPVRRGDRPLSSGDTGSAHLSPSVFLRMAQEALADGDLARAEKYATDAVKFGGADTHPRIRAEAESFLAPIAAQQGRLEEAEDRYRTACAIFESLGDRAAVGRAVARLGRFMIENRRYAAALSELQTAVNRTSGEPDIEVDLALATWLVGQPVAAVGVLGRVLTVDPGHVSALVLRGRIHVNVGELAAARHDLRNAVRLDPSLSTSPEFAEALRVAGNDADGGEPQD